MYIALLRLRYTLEACTLVMVVTMENKGQILEKGSG